MANYRATKSGFALEAQRKMDEKFDESLAAITLEWVGRITGESISTAGDADNFYSVLKDGTLLCKLANALLPGSIKGTVKPGKMTFTAGENYAKFFTAVTKDPLNMKSEETFQTVDLWEKANLTAVQTCLASLGRKAYALGDDKGVGPKESKGEKRDFSEEQLRAGNSIVGLQAGSNRGANQSGQNFGKPRGINDITL